VIQTYLMWNAKRKNILMGKAIMVRKKTIKMEYCNKLLR